MPGTNKNFLSYYSQMRKMTHKEVMTTKPAKSQFAILLMTKSLILYCIKGWKITVSRLIACRVQGWHMNCIYMGIDHDFMIA